MRILKDEETGIYEQHDGYFDLPHVDVKNIPMSQVPIYKNWAYIKIFRFNMIKQPDFLNLPLLLQSRFHDGRERRPITSFMKPEPAMNRLYPLHYMRF